MGKIRNKIVNFFGFHGSNIAFKAKLKKYSNDELKSLYLKCINTNKISSFNKQYRKFCVIIFQEMKQRGIL